MRKRRFRLHPALVIVFFLLAGVGFWLSHSEEEGSWPDHIPAYSGDPWVMIEEDRPAFDNISAYEFESYSELDALGRCGTAMACVGPGLMPTETRGSLESIRPSGWRQAKYPDIIGEDPPFLYNRCHLIAYQLTGENANRRNLITGTRYMNVEGMQPWENQVAEYIRWTGHHVMYRVTPLFIGQELVCRGVEMEALSVEDDEICFHIFVYNVQPGIEIDYRTGASSISRGS